MLVHDKPHDGTGGAVRWEIEASADAEVILMPWTELNFASYSCALPCGFD